MATARYLQGMVRRKPFDAARIAGRIERQDVEEMALGLKHAQVTGHRQMLLSEAEGGKEVGDARSSLSLPAMCNLYPLIYSARWRWQR